MLVVDTNVIAALYLPNTNTAHAEQLLNLDANWVAPSLWRSELRNVLALYLRKKLLSFEQAYQIQTQAEALMQGQEYALSSLEVLKIAANSGCSAYDAEFIALSQFLNVKLVTQDKEILEKFPQLTIPLNKI